MIDQNSMTINITLKALDLFSPRTTSAKINGIDITICAINVSFSATIKAKYLTIADYLSRF